MKPKVLIDLGKLKNLYTGLGQVSLNYGHKLAEINRDNFDLSYMLPSNFFNQFGASVQYVPLSNRRRYLPFTFPDVDLWHALHPDSAYLPPNRKIPFLLTINDLNFMDEKSRQKANIRLNRLQKKVNRACAITFISEYSRSVAMQQLNINIPTYVFHVGVEVDKKIPTTISDTLSNFIFSKTKGGGTKGNDTTKNQTHNPKISSKENNIAKQGETTRVNNLLFAVGIVVEKKNFMVLVEMMKHLPDYKLVIAGDNTSPYAHEIKKKITDLKLSNQILLPGKISNEERTWLYAKSKAFFFPSLIEGFGMPAIEAMHYGTPVFLSKYTSLPEVGAKAALYWQNFEPQYMASFFTKNIAKAEKEKEAAIRKKHASTFTWKKNVENYLKLYTDILS